MPQIKKQTNTKTKTTKKLKELKKPKKNQAETKCKSKNHVYRSRTPEYKHNKYKICYF